MRENALVEARHFAKHRRTAGAACAAGWVAAVAMLACASIGGRPSGDDYKQWLSANAAAPEKLSFGMTKAEATAVMGDAEARPPWLNDRGIGPQIVRNPFDSLQFESPEGEAYEVRRYAVGLYGEYRCPFVHGDAEFVPLIFFEEKLVGWRWSYIESVLQRRLRSDERAWSFGRFCDGGSQPQNPEPAPET
jgi:hypothetical protein